LQVKYFQPLIIKNMSTAIRALLKKE